MGNLLKETLKRVCNSNQWLYAVFWKIGCQNPKLLIWEECHYQALPMPSSVPAALEKTNLCSGEWQSRRLSEEEGSTRFGFEAENKVCLLLNKMRFNNQINVVGEGIVGRAAFSGKHLWILSKPYNRNTHPPEVSNELHHQFSSGMQTIAVIPIFPHGVVQLGSSLAIMEDMRFVDEVKSLILHLGSIPGALLPENYATKDSENEFHLPVPCKIPTSENPCAEFLKSSVVVDGYNFGYSESVDHNLDLPISSLNYCNSEVPPTVKPNHGLHGEWFDLQPSFGSRCDFLAGSGELSGGFDCFECSPTGVNLSQLRISGGLVQNPGSSESVDDDMSYKSLNAELIQPDYDTRLSETTAVFLLQQNSHESGNENSSLHTSGDDLFSVLGVKLKNKLLDGKSSPRNSGVDCSLVYGMHDSALLSDIHSSMDGVSESGMFRYSDHLLDAVVSAGCFSTKQSSEDNASKKTTLMKMSSSSSPSFNWAGTSDHQQGDLFELPSQLSSSGTLDTDSGYGKNDMGSCSWGEQGKNVGQDSNSSMTYSKRTIEVNKSNRKRPKPRENPKPRPKDRQMFQDRLKELREIVPNGAKYSIDALLESTVKHMLFLQSIAKHADKLKQTSESKMQSSLIKEDGLFLKDDLEGGATWAFEVDSESMVCPLIIKDLNSPRQMLIEMLCEDRGFFLEIAELIRGLGLTILNGVMETRTDKIWTCFAVEANRDVTRMEIFMSLVHLLEQTVKGGGPCLADAIESGSHIMVHNSFPQTPPIPATGLPECLV